MKFKAGILMLAAASMCLAAEDDGNSFRRSRQNGGSESRSGMMQRGGMPRGGMMQRGGGMMQRNQLVIEAEIAKKYPGEFAKVEALREKYEAELSALAARAGVQIPETMESKMRRIRKNHPAEFAAAMEKMKNSPREGMGELTALGKKDGIELFGGRGGFRGGMGADRSAPGSRNVGPDISALRRKYPEEMKKYDALRGSDPAAARKMLLDLMEKDRGDGKK